MADFNVSNPTYSNKIRMLEKSDPAHANIFNPMFQQLLENNEAIKHMKDDSNDNTYHFGVENGLLYIESDK